MLQLFAKEPLTTKQVADRLGEKPTRLYNHARALEQAGLIRLVRTRQNRGTTERYLEAVGSQFEVDERLFALGPSGSAAREATYATAAAILRNAAGELARPAPESKGPEPLVGQASFCLTSSQYRRLRLKVLGWMEGIQGARRRVTRGQRSDSRDELIDAVLTVALLPARPAPASGRGSRSRAGSV